MKQNGFDKPASLTAALLARKGEAQPALARQSTSQNRLREVTGGQANASDDAPISNDDDDAYQRSNGTARAASSSGVAAESNVSRGTGGTPGRRPIGCGERVALTLRLDHERHMRLKLLGVHLNKSSQEILEAAVDELLERHAAVTGGDCRCLVTGKATKACNA